MDEEDYTIELDYSGEKSLQQRILVATPTTGLVRIEWVQGRYGQVVPVNWSTVNYIETIPGYYALNYLVADAQNVICHVALERNFEWLLLWEHDTIAPYDSFIRLNDYIRAADIPVVSGLYYNRGVPSEPLIFRGRGTGAFLDWKKGDKVWCDGVPTGFLLIHMSILREMAKEADTYTQKGVQMKRIFETPRRYMKYENGDVDTVQGTSDLDWCTRVMEGNYFEKAGWSEYQKMQYPFLVDTNIFCRHVNPDGEMFP